MLKHQTITIKYSAKEVFLSPWFTASFFTRPDGLGHIPMRVSMANVTCIQHGLPHGYTWHSRDKWMGIYHLAKQEALGYIAGCILTDVAVESFYLTQLNKWNICTILDRGVGVGGDGWGTYIFHNVMLKRFVNPWFLKGIHSRCPVPEWACQVSLGAIFGLCSAVWYLIHVNTLPVKESQCATYIYTNINW